MADVITTLHPDNAPGIDLYPNIKLENIPLPVGFIYISTSSTSPASLFGGTWERIEDRFLLGGSGSHTPGSTGGSSTHSHTLENGSACFIPREGGYSYAKTRSTSTYSPNKYCQSADVYSDFSEWTVDGGIALIGSTDASSELPPYLSVYIWKKVA